MKCSFCEKAFDEDSARKECGQCAVFAGCKKVKCPHCGGESPQEPDSLKWLSKMMRKKRPAQSTIKTGLRSLCDGEPESEGRVAYLATKDARQVRKLAAMGILPGANIKAIQRFPSYVFQVGYSQFAVDRNLAEVIYVHWDE